MRAHFDHMPNNHHEKHHERLIISTFLVRCSTVGPNQLNESNILGIACLVNEAASGVVCNIATSAGKQIHWR